MKQQSSKIGRMWRGETAHGEQKALKYEKHTKALESNWQGKDAADRVELAWPNVEGRECQGGEITGGSGES
jgi:hypothetical protein